MTTVGFGDPATTGTGKAVAAPLAIIGVGLIAILTGAIAQRFLAPAVTEIEEAEEDVETNGRAPARPSELDKGRRELVTAGS